MNEDVKKIFMKLEQAAEQGSSYILTNNKCKILLEYLKKKEEENADYEKFLKNKIAYYQKRIDKGADDYDCQYECENNLKDYQKLISTGEIADFYENN